MIDAILVSDLARTALQGPVLGAVSLLLLISVPGPVPPGADEPEAAS